MILRRKILIIVILATILGIGGLGVYYGVKPDSKSGTIPTEISKEPKVVTPVEKVDYYNPLTGVASTPAIARNRPVAVMINNIQQAMPQAGISQADVFYEIPVEGNVTRTMALFQDWTQLAKVGSIRSSRLYFAQIARGYDAVYVHYGQSKYALDYLKSGAIDTLSPLAYRLDKTVFYRSQQKSSPHNVYSDASRLQAGFAAMGYDGQHANGYHGPFRFKLIGEVVPEGPVANRVYPGFSYSDTSLVYNQETRIYERNEFNQEQIDEANGQQLAFKNVIIQYVPAAMENDNYTLNFKVAGSGSGYYITNGKAQAINWQCASVGEPTIFYDESGAVLMMNAGKTNINIVPEKMAKLTEITN